MLSEFFGLSFAQIHVHVAHSVVAAEHEFLADASLGARGWDSEGVVCVLANDLVGVVDVDSNPLRIGTISADSDVLVPAINREVIVDEPVFNLADSEVVKSGLPVLALFGGSEVFGVLGWLNSEEDTA